MGPFLLLLGLFYIEQNILMNVGNQPHLLHKMFGHGLHISNVISLGSQRMQIVVSPQARWTPVKIMKGDNFVLD
jgi:hypothetical protein